MIISSLSLYPNCNAQSKKLYSQTHVVTRRDLKPTRGILLYTFDHKL